MQELGGAPHEHVYIGDNLKKDFAAPRALGWHTVCVRRPDGVYSKENAHDKNFEADFLVTDLYQAARLLDSGFTIKQQPR
jgi:FMN phosphatase YigB (HAD superfamily)